MTIGVCKLRLHLPENRSLKGKRQLVRSLTAKVRNRYNASIAEVEAQDQWQMAVLGLACVSNNGQHAEEMVAKIVAFIEEESRFQAHLVDYQTEPIHAF